MKRFYMVIRTGDVLPPENGDSIYNRARPFYTIRGRTEAKALGSQLAAEHGGAWSVFRLELGGNTSMAWEAATE
jgi:hypothetical protein